MYRGIVHLYEVSEGYVGTRRGYIVDEETCFT